MVKNLALIKLFIETRKYLNLWNIFLIYYYNNLFQNNKSFLYTFHYLIIVVKWENLLKKTD